MLKDLPCQLVEKETYKLLDMDEDLLIDTPTSKGEIRNPDDDGLLVEMPEVEVNENDPNIIKVIGVGGGGGNAVANMYKSNIEGVRFLVCNSDSKALRDSPISHRVQLGPGLGAGGKPEFGRKLAEENIEAIRGMFDDQTKMVFISAGMGGGTGTGAAPIIARESMKRGILTIGIVTIPFLFEMRKRIDLALDGVECMANEVDALLVINNERLRQIYPDLTLLNGFKKADDTLTKAVKSIVEIITMHGRINLDFRDVETCLKGGGVAVMSSGFGVGQNRVMKAIEEALNSPLINDRDIFRSKSLRIAIFGPPDESGFGILTSEIDEVDKFMSNFNRDVDAKYGLSEDASLGESVKVTILASGFKTYAGQEEEIVVHSPLTAEQQDEVQRLSIRREVAYQGAEKRRSYRRVYIFEDSDLDDEILVSMIENNDVLNRTEIDMRKFREESLRYKEEILN